MDSEIDFSSDSDYDEFANEMHSMHFHKNKYDDSIIFGEGVYFHLNDMATISQNSTDNTMYKLAGLGEGGGGGGVGVFVF